MSYAANTIVSVVCLGVTWRVTGPLLRDVVRGVPRRREVPGIRVIDTAGPQLAQSLVMPIAYGTDRLLLSHLAGVGQLAEYNLGAQLFGLVTQTVVVAGVAMWPQFARARAAGRAVQGTLGTVAAHVRGDGDALARQEVRLAGGLGVAAGALGVHVREYRRAVGR